METKVCNKCGRELPINRFHKCKGMKDGYRNICKMCKSIETREWRMKKLSPQQGNSTKKVEVITEPVNVKTKTCAKCGKELPIGSFYTNNKSKSGYNSYCKKCHSIAVYESKNKYLEKVKKSRISEFTTKEMITELKGRISTWVLKKLVFNKEK